MWMSVFVFLCIIRMHTAKREFLPAGPKNHQAVPSCRVASVIFQGLFSGAAFPIMEPLMLERVVRVNGGHSVFSPRATYSPRATQPAESAPLIWQAASLSPRRAIPNPLNMGSNIAPVILPSTRSAPMVEFPKAPRSPRAAELGHALDGFRRPQVWRKPSPRRVDPSA